MYLYLSIAFRIDVDNVMTAMIIATVYQYGM